jgi:hypothetical protein
MPVPGTKTRVVGKSRPRSEPQPEPASTGSNP